MAGKFCRIASMLVLPQRPQLLEIVPNRLVEFSFVFTSLARPTMTLLSLAGESVVI